MSSVGRKDHPRRCGEHLLGAYGWSHHLGSSPQMRGALDMGFPNTENPRIIPADAGSTNSICRREVPCGDHPRRCGEHLMAAISRW